MTLEQLKELLDHHFGPKFLPAGIVTTKWVKGAEYGGEALQVKIGPRDVWIERTGHVSGSGSDVTGETDIDFVRREK
jgi:hypothetical protein